MENELFDASDVFVQMEFNTKQDFFEFITNHLQKENKIKEGFKDSLLNREKSFPTGLVTETMGIAIPHTEYEYSNTNQIVITTLKQPLEFKRMDDPTENVDVSIILLILFDKPEKQPEILKQIMTTIQDKSFLDELLQQENVDNVLKLLKK